MPGKREASIVSCYYGLNGNPPFTLDGQEHFINAKIGIATYPQDGDDVDTLLRNAEAAMYQIDRSSKKNFQFYSADMNASASRKLFLESQLYLFKRN